MQTKLNEDSFDKREANLNNAALRGCAILEIHVWNIGQ